MTQIASPFAGLFSGSGVVTTLPGELLAPIELPGGSEFHGMVLELMGATAGPAVPTGDKQDGQKSAVEECGQTPEALECPEKASPKPDKPESGDIGAAWVVPMLVAPLPQVGQGKPETSAPVEAAPLARTAVEATPFPSKRTVAPAAAESDPSRPKPAFASAAIPVVGEAPVKVDAETYAIQRAVRQAHPDIPEAASNLPAAEQVVRPGVDTPLTPGAKMETPMTPAARGETSPMPAAGEERLPTPVARGEILPKPGAKGEILPMPGVDVVRGTATPDLRMQAHVEQVEATQTPVRVAEVERAVQSPRAEGAGMAWKPSELQPPIVNAGMAEPKGIPVVTMTPPKAGVEEAQPQRRMPADQPDAGRSLPFKQLVPGREPVAQLVERDGKAVGVGFPAAERVSVDGSMELPFFEKSSQQSVANIGASPLLMEDHPLVKESIEAASPEVVPVQSAWEHTVSRPTTVGGDGVQSRASTEEVLRSKVAHQVVQAARVRLFEGGGDITLRLDPPHLGTVHMSVSSSDGVVTATLQAGTETAKQILQADLPALKQALLDAGVNVETINVSTGGSPNQGWNAQSGSGGGNPGTGAWKHAQSTGGMFGSETHGVFRDDERPGSTGRFDHLA